MFTRYASVSSNRPTPTIKAVLRRARGMRDEAMLLLKLKVGHRPPDSVRSRLGAVSEGLTAVNRCIQMGEDREMVWAIAAS